MEKGNNNCHFFRWMRFTSLKKCAMDNKMGWVYFHKFSPYSVPQETVRSDIFLDVLSDQDTC